jgi:hypothetical protein
MNVTTALVEFNPELGEGAIVSPHTAAVRPDSGAFFGSCPFTARNIADALQIEVS